MRRKIVAAGLACMLSLEGCTIVVGGLVYAASRQRGGGKDGRFAYCTSHYTGQQQYDCINRAY